MDAGFENYMSCREMIKMRHNRRWRALANRIDEWCRVWVPVFYITCLFMLFNVSLDDGYGPDKDGVVKSRVVFQGLPPVIEIEDGMAGAVRILALPVIVLILGPMFFCARQLLLKSLTKDQNREFLNKSFGLKPNYSWVKQFSWWGWLFSTAHAVNNNDIEGEEKWGPRYTAADLDRLIGYKIYPDSRTRLVEGHKVAQEDKKAGGGSGGRFWNGDSVRPSPDEDSVRPSPDEEEEGRRCDDGGGGGAGSDNSALGAGNGADGRGVHGCVREYFVADIHRG